MVHSQGCIPKPLAVIPGLPSASSPLAPGSLCPFPSPPSPTPLCFLLLQLFSTCTNTLSPPGPGQRPLLTKPWMTQSLLCPSRIHAGTRERYWTRIPGLAFKSDNLTIRLALTHRSSAWSLLGTKPDSLVPRCLVQSECLAQWPL